jgi:hypothetical protein
MITQLLLAFAVFRHSISLVMIGYAKAEADMLSCIALLYVIVVMLYVTGTDPLAQKDGSARR